MSAASCGRRRPKSVLPGGDDARFGQVVSRGWTAGGALRSDAGDGGRRARARRSRRYDTSPELEAEWARRLAFDPADFEAIRSSDKTAGPRMLWSVATLRSNADREAWVAAQRLRHPYLRILNATSKARPARRPARGTETSRRLRRLGHRLRRRRIDEIPGAVVPPRPEALPSPRFGDVRVRAETERRRSRTWSRTTTRWASAARGT